MHVINALSGLRYYISPEERKVRLSCVVMLGLAAGRDRYIPFNFPAFNKPIPLFSKSVGLNLEFKKHFNIELSNEGPFDFALFFKFGYAF